MNQFELLKSKLILGNATIGVIGLGYVGLPLAHAMYVGGFKVLGFDIDSRKIDSIEKGENYLRHLGDEMVKDLSSTKNFTGTTDFSQLSEPDAIIVCVPTTLCLFLLQKWRRLQKYLKMSFVQSI